jgi:hypothetical protein
LRCVGVSQQGAAQTVFCTGWHAPVMRDDAALAS